MSKLIYKVVLPALGILFGVYVLLLAIVYVRQRSLIFFPTHAAPNTRLTPWSDGSRTIGYCRERPAPKTIWLMTHGNAGQAANRDYLLPCLSEEDSLYVLEYPGYGSRPGTPSRESMNQAASEAYRFLRSRFPNTHLCVLGESIGSGPACFLAAEKTPPDKIVLAVPFDSLANVAASHFPFLPVRLLLRDRWNNIEALGHYTGPVDIFAATDDTIIAIRHARTLAKAIPKSKLITIAGGHNDWSEQPQVKLAFP